MPRVFDLGLTSPPMRSPRPENELTSLIFDPQSRSDSRQYFFSQQRRSREMTAFARLSSVA